LLGGDDDTPAPARPSADGGDDGPVGNDAGEDGGGVDGSIDGSLDGASCSANGSLDLDPTFGSPTTPGDFPRAALSAGGTFGVVARCRDGGAGLELAHVAGNGSV